jgi:alpha-1,3-fucosyltransferase 10
MSSSLWRIVGRFSSKGVIDSGSCGRPQRSAWQQTMSNKPTILFYNTFFDHAYELSHLDEEIRSAFIFDRALYENADAVIFHMPDLIFGTPTIADVSKLLKPKGQLWVAWSMESAINYPVQDDLSFMRRFDLVMSYKRSADIWVPYCPSRWTWLEAMRRPLAVKTEEAPLVMFQSAPFNKSCRIEFASELMNQIKVDSYGRILNNKIPPQNDEGTTTKLKTISRYKFCLSLENAIEADYVTEKLFDPLLVGAVPVYRGAPNVGDFVPGEHCFVDANDFSGPGELAEYIKYLDSNDEAYRRYFAWRNAPLSSKFEKNILDRQVDPFVTLMEIVKERKHF